MLIIYQIVNKCSRKNLIFDKTFLKISKKIEKPYKIKIILHSNVIVSVYYVPKIFDLKILLIVQFKHYMILLLLIQLC